MKKNYSNCFANIKGGCSILKQKLCDIGDCPFYKSKQQNEEDKRKYPHIGYSSRKKEVKTNGRKKNGG